jgi:hypothetical protein
MIRLIVKLAIAALIANAAWRIGSAYASFYRLKDAVEQTTQYGPEKSDDVLRARVLELSAQYDLPMAEDAVSIKRELNHTIVDGSIVRQIEVFPGYTRPWPFTLHVDTFVVK